MFEVSKLFEALTSWEGPLKARALSPQDALHEVLSECNKIMVVAHPDDEVLWGGLTLAREPGWGVLCLTNASTGHRKRAMARAMEVLGCRWQIFDVPDRRTQEPSDEDRSHIRSVLQPVFEANVSRILTHSPDGETGHRLHVAISDVASEMAGERSLSYFSFDPAFDAEIAEPQSWARKVSAMQEYFGDLRCISGNDALHVKLSRHERPVAADEYRRPNELLRRIYGESSVPAGSIEKGRHE